MKRITDSVYCEDQFSKHPNFFGCNTSFIVTSEGIVLIDTPYMPTMAMKWRDNIATIGEICYIINTDQHLDHVTGNFFFPGTVISHNRVREMFPVAMQGLSDTAIAEGILKDEQRTVGDILVRLQTFDPEGLPLLENYQPRPPKITFSEKMDIYAGDHVINLMYLPGHTRSHIGIYLPEEKVFFSGDNVTFDTRPSFAQSSPLEWVNSLKIIEAMDIDILVPGHGEVCSKRDLHEFRLFIEECIALVKGAISKGLSKEEIADTLSFEGLYPKNHPAQALHPEPEWQRRDILRVYNMLSQ